MSSPSHGREPVRTAGPAQRKKIKVMQNSANQEIVDKLTNMGISRELAEQACIETSNSSSAAAVRWALDHFAEEVKKVMDEKSPSRSCTATANLHSRHQTSSSQNSNSASGKTSRDQPAIWTSTDPVRANIGGQQRKLTTAGSRQYDIIEISTKTPDSLDQDPLGDIRREIRIRKSTTRTFPAIARAHKNSVPDRRVFPPRNRVVSLMKKATDDDQNAPKASMERPGSGWTQKTALEEMRELRNELAQLRSALREDKEQNVGLGRSRQKPGMIYAHRVIPMSHVD